MSTAPVYRDHLVRIARAGAAVSALYREVVVAEAAAHTDPTPEHTAAADTAMDRMILAVGELDAACAALEVDHELRHGTPRCGARGWLESGPATCVLEAGHEGNHRETPGPAG